MSNPKGPNDNPKDDVTEKSLRNVKQISSNVYEVSFGRKSTLPPTATSASATSGTRTALPGKTAIQGSAGMSGTRILKAGEYNETDVQSFSPEKLQKSAIETTLPTEPSPILSANAGLDGLRQNLQTLSQLHTRLKFMLKELEEYVSE